MRSSYPQMEGDTCICRHSFSGSFMQIIKLNCLVQLQSSLSTRCFVVSQRRPTSTWRPLKVGSVYNRELLYSSQNAIKVRSTQRQLIHGVEITETKVNPVRGCRALRRLSSRPDRGGNLQLNLMSSISKKMMAHTSAIEIWSWRPSRCPDWL